MRSATPPLLRLLFVGAIVVVTAVTTQARMPTRQDLAAVEERWRYTYGDAGYGHGVVPQPAAVVRHPVPPLHSSPPPRTPAGSDAARRGDGRRFVLCATTGYSGSQFLTKVLGSAAEATCFHERQPSVVQFPTVLRHGLAATYNARRQEKVASILGDLTHAPPFVTDAAAVYCVCDHMAVKSWADVVLDWLLRDPTGPHAAAVDVVVLHRAPAAVVRSAMAVGSRGWSPTMPLSAYRGGEYTVHHTNFSVLPPLTPSPQCESTADLITGYVLDMAAQIRRLRRAYPDATFHDVRLEELSTHAGRRELLRRLQLTPTTDTATAAATWTSNNHASSFLTTAPLAPFEALVGDTVRRYTAGRGARAAAGDSHVVRQPASGLNLTALPLNHAPVARC